MQLFITQGRVCEKDEGGFGFGSCNSDLVFSDLHSCRKFRDQFGLMISI